MPAHATTVPEYCAVLGRGKLVPEAEVQALYQRWRAEAQGDDADVDRFRRYLVRKRVLTEYQAALVQRGHADGFFLGGYVILDRLGKGHSAAGVYKAAHSSGQVVALKVLPSSRAKDPNALTRFQREGRLLAQLDHPNVVRAFHVGHGGGKHFIVMEHLDGETLDEVLARRKQIPPAEAVRLVYQALRGLQHLHDRRMVHRDLKPANLMVTRPPGPAAPPPAAADTTLDATLKVLDVGIGRELFDDDSPETKDLQITTEGAILGTPDYLAPEQARDARSADVRSDVYSLGCVLFHLLAGRPPFPDKHVMALMVKHATEQPPPLATVAAGVPAGLQAVFDKMTAKKPDDRYQTPDEAADALRPFLPPSAHTVTAQPVLPAYRQWLESESAADGPAEPRKPAGGTAPAAVVPAAAPTRPGSGAFVPVPASRPVPTSSPRPPARPPRPATEDEIDVELVTLPPPAPVVVAPAAVVPPAAVEEEPRSLTELDRRDFVMLGMGAGGVLMAIGVGYGLARALKRVGEIEPKDETAAPDEGKPTGK